MIDMTVAARICCQATRRDGSSCRAPALTAEEGLCFAHAPRTAALRDRARRQGGHNSATLVRMRRLVPARLQPVFDRLTTALDEVHAGEIDPRVATAMASVAQALVRVLTAGELEERVRRLDGGGERAARFP